MNIQEKNVLMLHQFHRPHPAHKAFGDAVEADYVHFETGDPIGGEEANLDSMMARLETAVSLGDYDIVIGEGTTPIYTLLFYKLFNNTEASVVPLIADETFRTIRTQKSHYLWKAFISPLMNRTFSGGIAVSNLCKSWSRPYLDIPFEIVHPCIDDAKYDLLYGIKDSYSVSSPATIVHAGTVSDNLAVRKKNVNVLAQSISKQGKWRLRLIGTGHDKYPYGLLPGVETTGYIDSLSDFAQEFSNADVYVQASVGDAFPVASLEAMLAGVPTIVSTETGTKEIVEPIDPRLVCEPTSRGITRSIEYTLSLTPEQRARIASEQQAAVAEFSKENQAKQFTMSLARLTS